jgi:chromosome segregation ATPase
MQVPSRWKFLLIALLLAAPSLAQQPGDPRQSRERELLRRQADQIRSLEAERATLQAQTAQLEEELKKTKAQAAAASRARTQQARIDEVETRLTEVTAERDKLRLEVDTATQAGAEQRKQLAELRAALAAANERGGSLNVNLAERSEQLRTCAANNDRLTQLGKEILDRLSDGTCRRGPQARWEPFTQFGRVRFEQQLEAYRDRIADERFMLPVSVESP